MEEKARQNFLVKLHYQGFILEDRVTEIILSPPSIGVQGSLTISETVTGEWQVTAGTGVYARWAKGKNRQWFEELINQLAAQSIAELV